MKKPQVKRHLIIKASNKEDRTLEICATEIVLSYLLQYCDLAPNDDIPLIGTFRLRVKEAFDFDEVYEHLLELELDRDAAAEIVAETEEFHRRMAEMHTRQRNHGGLWMSFDD